jgi:AraC-like DNA-binding protein
MAARLSGCVENPTAVGELLEKVPVVDGPNLEFAALVARNLVQNEGPTILEPELSNSNTSRSENLQPCSPAATTGALVGTYGKYLHHQRICRKVVEMMEQQFASPITVGRLANAFNISPNYLALLFRKTMGMTITDHLTRTRIQKAQQLLQRTDVNVKEAAFRVGFSDANYFTSVFRKATGLTPSQWRARCDEELLQARPINPHFKPTQPAK